MNHLRIPAVLGLALACACPRPKPQPAELVPAGCNPLAYETDCLLPYPSDHFLVADPSMPSGRRVDIPEPARFQADSGRKVDLFILHPADGFSHAPAILAAFPVTLSTANLHGYATDLSTSTAVDSATVILDAETRERVLHVSELDTHAVAPAIPSLALRPVVRLKNRHRYIVALRDLRDTAGQPVAAPSGFRRIRDGAADTPLLQSTQDRFNAQVFPVLEAAGIPRTSLTLAWDFTTTSLENVTRDMLDARALLVAALDAVPPPVTVLGVYDDDSQFIWRRIEAQMEVPSFMESQDFGAYLNRGADGRVARNGITRVAFTVLVPRSIKDGPATTPARILQYGHGFFGGRSEMQGGFVTEFIQLTGMVAIGVDWWGMSAADVATVADDLLNNLEQTSRFTERVHQGMMNQLALEYVARQVLPAMTEMQVDGHAITDGTEHYFYGISQGHILGGTFAGLSRFVDRIAFSVGGMGLFSLISMRAMPFHDYLVLISHSVTNPLEQQKLLAMAQSSIDRIDPATYAVMVRSSALPSAPPVRHVLVQSGLGDAAVPSIAAEAHARSLGLVHLTPGPKALAGFEESDGPVADSAYVQFDFHVATDPLPGTYADFPVEENSTHESVRRSAPGRAQVDGFLRPNGTIVNHCSGACDPD